MSYTGFLPELLKSGQESKSYFPKFSAFLSTLNYKLLSNTFSWMILILAGLFEVGFTSCLKLSEDFTNVKWTIGFFICITLSFSLLNKATQVIPLGTGYAVWTGIGAVGTVIVGIIFFKEPYFFWRMFFIFLLIGSIVGLKIVSSH